MDMFFFLEHIDIHLLVFERYDQATSRRVVEVSFAEAHRADRPTLWLRSNAVDREWPMSFPIDQDLLAPAFVDQGGAS